MIRQKLWETIQLKKPTQLCLNSSSYAPFIYDCLIALAPNKEILVSCKREKFLRVKPPFPKSLIRWIENFYACCLVYKCMRLVVFHTICPLVLDSFWSLFICLFFPEVLFPEKYTWNSSYTG